MGFLMSGGIYLLNTYNSVQTKIETEDKTRSLQDAIQNFVGIHKRYPCPARIDLAPDASGFGQEDCGIDDVSGRDGLDVLIGTVPVRTLNVPDSNIVDGYGRRYIYAVTTDRTAIDGTADVVNGMGAITILHSVNGHEETLSNEAGFVVYALMTSGADDRGAYDINGNEISPCVEGTIAGENCDFDDAVFKTTIVSTTGADTDFSHKFAFVAKGPAFYWHTGPWSECGRKYTRGNPSDQSLWSGSGTDNRSAYGHTAATPICDSSHQERLVECRKKQGSSADVVDADCSHTPRPVSLRACAIAPCEWVQRAPTCSGDPEPEPPTCDTSSRTQSRPRPIECPSGQTGFITVIEERNLITNTDCSTSYTDWIETSREENCTIPECDNGAIYGSSYWRGTNPNSVIARLTDAIHRHCISKGSSVTPGSITSEIHSGECSTEFESPWADRLPEREPRPTNPERQEFEDRINERRTEECNDPDYRGYITVQGKCNFTCERPSSR